VLTASARAFIAGAVNVAVQGWPVRMSIASAVSVVTTASSLPSPLKSPTATEKGREPTATVRLEAN